MELVVSLVSLGVLIWVLTRLGKIAEEATRTRAILAILHDRELAEQAGKLRARAERETNGRERQRLLDGAEAIGRYLRWP